MIKIKPKKTTKNNSVEENFLDLLSAPARRALENNGIKTIQKLAQYSEKEILNLHGMGKARCQF